MPSSSVQSRLVWALQAGPRPRIAYQATLAGRRSAEELHPGGLGGGRAQRGDAEALGALELDERSELLTGLRAQRSDLDEEGIDHACEHRRCVARGASARQSKAGGAGADRRSSGVRSYPAQWRARLRPSRSRR
jgi:hypothetical protein